MAQRGKILNQSHKSRNTHAVHQDALVARVAGANANTIVVVNSVGPIEVEAWISHPNGENHRVSLHPLLKFNFVCSHRCGTSGCCLLFLRLVFTTLIRFGVVFQDKKQVGCGHINASMYFNFFDLGNSLADVLYGAYNPRSVRELGEVVRS